MKNQSNGGFWTTRPTPGKAAFFLLSDALLGTGISGDVYFDNSGNTSNAWQSSTAKTWCNNFYGSSFSNGEQGAVLATTKSDEAFTKGTGGISFAASENILNGDKVFFLSAEEAENSAYGFTDDNARIANYGNSAGVWWLRSPYDFPRLCGLCGRGLRRWACVRLRRERCLGGSSRFLT